MIMSIVNVASSSVADEVQSMSSSSPAEVGCSLCAWRTCRCSRCLYPKALPHPGASQAKSRAPRCLTFVCVESAFFCGGGQRRWNGKATRATHRLECLRAALGRARPVAPQLAAAAPLARSFVVVVVACIAEHAVVHAALLVEREMRAQVSLRRECAAVARRVRACRRVCLADVLLEACPLGEEGDAGGRGCACGVHADVAFFCDAASGRPAGKNVGPSKQHTFVRPRVRGQLLVRGKRLVAVFVFAAEWLRAGRAVGFSDVRAQLVVFRELLVASRDCALGLRELV